MTLTPKQQRFVDEYLIDLSASAAYRRAGYVVKTDNVAYVEGHRLLRNPKIQQLISAKRQDLAKKFEVTQERVVAWYARIAFGDPRRVMSWGPGGVVLRNSAELTDDEAAMVAEVSQTITKDRGTVRLKLHDKLAALDALAKHLGMFKSNTVFQGDEIKVVFVDNWGERKHGG